MGYEVVTHREITFPLYRDEPYGYGDVIPNEAFDTVPGGRGSSKVRTLMNLAWIRPVDAQAEEPGAVKIDDEADAETAWPKWHGGPWFLTPDGKKHRGKKKALEHMGKL